jgi:hypothetical protein
LDKSDYEDIDAVCTKSNDLFETIGDCGDEYRWLRKLYLIINCVVRDKMLSLNLLDQCINEMKKCSWDSCIWWWKNKVVEKMGRSLWYSHGYEWQKKRQYNYGDNSIF